MSTNWDEEIERRLVAPDEQERQGEGLGVIVWLLFFAAMSIIAGLLAAAGAILGG